MTNYDEIKRILSTIKPRGPHRRAYRRDKYAKPSLYIVEAPELRACKIGRSRNVQQRLRGLRNGGPPVHLVLRGCYEMPWECFSQFEKSMKILMRPHHWSGEWYRCTPHMAECALLSLIRAHDELGLPPLFGRVLQKYS